MSLLTPHCRVCGCTDLNCSNCIERTGMPCHWIEPDLCSACVDQKDPLKAGDRVKILDRPPGEGWPASIVGRFGTVETVSGPGPQAWCRVLLDKLPRERTEKSVGSLHIRKVEKVQLNK